jgi:hypothetical protein
MFPGITGRNRGKKEAGASWNSYDQAASNPMAKHRANRKQKSASDSEGKADYHQAYVRLPRSTRRLTPHRLLYSVIPSSSSPCAPPCPRIHSFLIQILRDMLPQCSAAAHITRGHAPPAPSTSIRQINKCSPTGASLSAVASRLTAERQPGTADAT